MQQMQQQEFRNETFTDFGKEENARAMRDALAQVAAELGREYPLVIGGERIKTGRTFDSTNPAKKTEVVGRFQKATEELARAAVENMTRVLSIEWARFQIKLTAIAAGHFETEAILKYPPPVAANATDYYPCSPNQYFGRERVFQFDNPDYNDVTFSLSGLTPGIDLDAFLIWTLKSSMRSCSLGIEQTRVSAGVTPSFGRWTTMIDGKTSASWKICLAWPKSTTDATQADSAKKRRSGSP